MQTKQKAPIKISELRALADAKDLQAIVVLTVERNGNVSVVTYGEDKAKCKAIGDWGQGLWRYAVSLIPFQTVFGWGYNGVPTDVIKDDQPLNLADARNLLRNC